MALGSSYAAGPGVAPLSDPACLRGSGNYPHLVAAALGVSLMDVTCSSAVVANILTTPQRSFGATMAPQIDAVTADTRLVTVTAAGNDLGYIGSLTADSCRNAVESGRDDGSVAATTSGIAEHFCPGAGADPTAHDADDVARELSSVVAEVRRRSPRAVVVLVDYLPVLDSKGTLCSHIPLTDSQRDDTQRTYSSLIMGTAAAARATGAALVQASAVGDRHAACGPEPYVDGFEIGPIWAGGAFPYHPNQAGMSAVSDLVVAAAVNELDS